MKICLVSSCGGHLTELRMLGAAYQKYSHFYVLNDKIKLSEDMADKTFFISHSERDWKFFLNLIEAWNILRKHKPDVIISTGAGPAVPFSIIGRYIFRTHVVFIESITCVTKPSVTGRIMSYIAHQNIYQWPTLARFYPKGQYGGLIL